MSTYTDLHNRAKETLNVDYHDRVTPQKVHFINPENSYHGEFIGEAQLSGNNHIDGGVILNVCLSNSTLDNVYFKNGLKLDTIYLTIGELSEDIDAEIIARKIADSNLCNEISTINDKLDVESLKRQNADTVLSVELTKRINYEVELSEYRDDTLNLKIDNEISDRISADASLEKRVNDKMLHDRHLELVNHDNKVYPIRIKDYAINTYIDSNADAYAYVNGNLDKAPIGKIENVILDDDYNVKSFTFNAFADHPDTYELTAKGKFIYNFDNENNKTIYTGVGGYRLNCDLIAGKSINEAQMVLDSSNNNGFYRAYFNDTRLPAGIINGNYGYDADNHISSCLFTVTSQSLSNFIRPVPYQFNSNGSTLYFTGTDGSECEITLCDNVFYMYEGHKTSYYLPVKNQTDNVQFAKIYSDGFKFDDEGTLTAVNAYVENHAGYYNLLKANEFKAQFDDAHKYTFVQYDEANNMLSIVELLIQYKYALNNAHGTMIPGINDSINKKIDDDYTTLGVTLTLPESEFASYVNDDYVLDKYENANIYICEKQITEDNFGTIKLTYNKDEHCLKVVIKQNAYPDAHILRLYIEDIVNPTKIDGSITKYASNRICEDIKNIKQSELVLVDESKNKYVVKPDLSKLEYSGETKVLISYVNDTKKDNIDLFMPDKEQLIPGDYDIASSKFLLNFKIYTRSLKDEGLVKLNLISKSLEDKFYYTNKPVKDIYVVKNRFTTLQFDEIRPHHYIITDLDYSEIDWRLRWLRNELSCHEISSYSTMMKLSDDVEFLLSTDREEMSYKGTLPFLSAESWKDEYGEIHYGKVTLSAFIAQSPYIYNGNLKLGDMFKLSAAQYGINALYDDTTSKYLGENDYFVINKLVAVSSVQWKDLDLFRNAETEVNALCLELMHQINTTSSYISSEVDRISTELSTELHNTLLSVNGLSIEVDRISSELSTTLKLSSEELQRQIVSNDNDIAELSDKVGFLLSVDKETVNYKGTVPAYTPADPDDKHNWLLNEYISACIKEDIEVGAFDVKKGDLFKVGVAPISVLFDYRKLENHTIALGDQDFFIANKDVEDVKYIEVEDFDVFRNALSEVTSLCVQLSTELKNTQLSVNGLSIEVDRICADLSIAHNFLNNALSSEILKLSTALSTNVDTLSANLSSEILKLSTALSTNVDTLSANLSNEIEKLSSALSTNVDTISANLSNEIEKLSISLSNTTKLSVEELQRQIVSNDNDISTLSGKIEFVLSTAHDTVAYQGTMNYYNPYVSPTVIDRSLSAYIANTLDKKYENHMKYGFMFKISAYQDDLSDENGQTTYFGANDFFIVNKNIANIEHIHVEDLDIVRNAEAETLKLSTELSTELCACELSVNGLSIEVDRISSELSTELCACELSVNGLSNEVDRISAAISSTIYRLSTEISTELCACELSVFGLSNEVDRISAAVSSTIYRLSTELSTTLSISSDSLQRLIVSNDNDISTISTDLSVLEHHYYDKTMSCNITLEHTLKPDVGQTSHISAIVDKLLIVDEVTFDLYALTIRNGALNINKVKTIDSNYHVDCCATK